MLRRLFRDKRGMNVPMNYVILIIMALVGGATVLFFIVGIRGPAEDAATSRACHDSVFLRAQSAPSILDTKMPFLPLSCKTQEEKLTGSRDQIKERMARMMAECWWQFNQGNFDEVFDSAALSRIFWDSSENSCFMCYVTPIDQDNIVGGSIEPTEMFEYMTKTKHYKYDMTYLDYIQGSGGPGQLSILSPIVAQKVNGIVYLSKNTDRKLKGWWVPTVSALVTVGVVACVIAQPCGVAVGVSVGGAAAFTTGFTGAEAVYKEFYSNANRDTSMIVLDSLEGIEMGQCDIKGLS